MTLFRHTMEALLNPLLWVIVISVMGLWARRRVWLFIAILLLVLISTGPLPYHLTHWLEQPSTIRPTYPADINTIVVLSGGQSRDNLAAHDVLNGASIKRLLAGVALYQSLKNPTLILSGGGFGNDLPEALQLKKLITDYGFQPMNVVLETKSLNTLSQAKALANMLHDKPFFLVTSAIHLPRAMRMMQAQGLKPVAIPTDFTLYWNDERWQKYWMPNGQNIVYVSKAMHELLGMAWVKITGSI